MFVIEKRTVSTIDGKAYTVLNDSDFVYLVSKYMGCESADIVEEVLNNLSDADDEINELEKDIMEFEKEISELKGGVN